jgi:hypothetical protein
MSHWYPHLGGQQMQVQAQVQAQVGVPWLPFPVMPLPPLPVVYGPRVQPLWSGG